jgi:hypothetical protein
MSFQAPYRERDDLVSFIQQHAKRIHKKDLTKADVPKLAKKFKHRNISRRYCKNYKKMAVVTA